MGVHHIALATRDIQATHRFYTQVMGFRLVKALAIPWPGSATGGWAKHLFYATGEREDAELVAFWALHDASVGAGFRTEVSTALGLPTWVNHVAFEARSAEELALRRARWLEHGASVTEVDHGFCRSIYTMDPNGILVEFCVTTSAFTPEDAMEAERLLHDSAPALEPPRPATLHRPGRPR